MAPLVSRAQSNTKCRFLWRISSADTVYITRLGVVSKYQPDSFTARTKYGPRYMAVSPHSLMPFEERQADGQRRKLLGYETMLLYDSLEKPAALCVIARIAASTDVFCRKRFEYTQPTSPLCHRMPTASCINMPSPSPFTHGG